MKVYRLTAAVAAGWMLMAAQGTKLVERGEAFVDAVRDRDSSSVQNLLDANGQIVVNSKSYDGETALLVAVSRRDDVWTSFLLNNGADPNLANRKGDTPLIAAARVGYLQGAQWLVGKKARVDETNRMGETALILAVQGRHAPLVKYLLSRGANPDKTDNAAGYSARDYARRDNRNPEILRLIEAAGKPAAAKPIG